MFSLTATHRFVLYSQPVSMSLSFDGLCGIVRKYLNSDPTEGTVFVFVNKARDKIKLLHWSGSGFVLYYKRLESGRFEVPSYEVEQGKIQLSYAQLVLLVDGISLTNLSRIKRYTSTLKSA